MNDAAQQTVEEAKQNLGTAAGTTQTDLGNPTWSFQQPNVIQAAKYHIARAARKQ